MADKSQAFYKNDNGVLAWAPNFVSTPTYELVATQHETYTYPVDGWYWFDDETSARVFLGIPDTSGFYSSQDNGATVTYASQIEVFGEAITVGNHENWNYPIAFDGVWWFWFDTRADADAQLLRPQQPPQGGDE